jgi:hypothetical protein
LLVTSWNVAEPFGQRRLRRSASQDPFNIDDALAFDDDALAFDIDKLATTDGAIRAHGPNNTINSSSSGCERAGAIRKSNLSRRLRITFFELLDNGPIGQFGRCHTILSFCNL